jgi:hypothetical protein
MEAYPHTEGYSDVVTVHWRLDGTDVTNSDGIYGATALQLDLEADFVPYEDLTQEQVIEWLHDALGEEQTVQNGE